MKAPIPSPLLVEQWCDQVERYCHSAHIRDVVRQIFTAGALAQQAISATPPGVPEKPSPHAARDPSFGTPVWKCCGQHMRKLGTGEVMANWPADFFHCDACGFELEVRP